MQKPKSSTNFNRKEGQQRKQLSIKALRFLILGGKIYRVLFILGTMFVGTNHPKGARGHLSLM